MNPQTPLYKAGDENNDRISSMYFVYPNEAQIFGANWQGVERYEAWKETLVAVYPKDPIDGDGQAVEIYCTAAPARFYSAKVLAGVNSLNEPQAEYEISCGSGSDAGRLLVEIAKQVNEGMICFKPVKEPLTPSPVRPKEKLPLPLELEDVNTPQYSDINISHQGAVLMTVLNADSLEDNYDEGFEDVVDAEARALADYVVNATNSHADLLAENLRLKEEKKELLEACEWINKFISTASDGGDAWCAVRNQPGASEWAKKMNAAVKKATQGGEQTND